MRVAALYDIHGNLSALEAVLDDVRDFAVDVVVVGGDVLPGPMPVACLDALDAFGVTKRWIGGNGEREVLALRAGGDAPGVPEAFLPALRWVAERLDDEAAARLAAWPATVTVDMPAHGTLLFCHATPRSDSEIFTRVTPEERVRPALVGVDAATVVCGHTHMQFDRVIGGRRVVNAGSVGMSFEGRGAYWLLVDESVELRRTDYDLEDAAERIRATDYPGAEAFALRQVLEPPGADAMLASLEKGAMA